MDGWMYINYVCMYVHVCLFGWGLEEVSVVINGHFVVTSGSKKNGNSGNDCLQQAGELAEII